MGKGIPVLPDLKTFIEAGINPKTRLPLKLANPFVMDKELKSNAKRNFRIQDEQRAVNCFKWYNLPAGISSQELERFLYYRYSLCFFYMPELGEFYFMPYTLNGTLDFYQRFNSISPVPMCESDKQGELYKRQLKVLSQYVFKVQKDVIVDAKEITEEKLTKTAVILRDYTNQSGQLGEPRAALNEHLLDIKADCECFLRLNLLIGSGIQAMRVKDADAYTEATNAAQSMYKSAIEGNPYMAIIAPVEFQELQPSSTLKASEFFLAMQSVDNMLLASHGIENTGIYEKQAHILESENQVNSTNVSLTLQDRLNQRQNFCNIVNSIWNLGIWCELSETVSGIDINGDGVNYDESTDGAGSGHSVDNEEQGGEE